MDFDLRKDYHDHYIAELTEEIVEPTEENAELIDLQGSKKCIGRSVHSSSWKKSVSLETELDEGEYVVHVSS